MNITHTPYKNYKKYKKDNLDDNNINNNTNGNNINVFGYRSSQWFTGGLLMAVAGGFVVNINHIIGWFFCILSVICGWCCILGFLKAIEKIADSYNQD